MLAREVQRSTRYQDFLSLCLVRLDYSGEGLFAVRATIAQRVAELLRFTDVVGSVGNDVALLLVHTPDSEASAIIQRLRDHVEGLTLPSVTGTPPRRIKVSMAIASFPSDATSDTALLARAQAQLPG
jgi:GGDEF domain-containing protein